MNDFSKHTEDFLYSKEYKEPLKLKFLDVSGSMSNIRILPIAEVHSGMSYFCANTAQQVTTAGQQAIEELLEELMKQRQEEKERRQDELDRSWHGMARTVLRGSGGSR